MHNLRLLLLLLLILTITACRGPDIPPDRGPMDAISPIDHDDRSVGTTEWVDATTGGESTTHDGHEHTSGFWSTGLYFDDDDSTTGPVFVTTSAHDDDNDDAPPSSTTWGPVTAGPDSTTGGTDSTGDVSTGD